MKRIGFGMLLIVLVFQMAFMGCQTTQHRVEIANVPNVREIYIRNAGTDSWSENLAGKNIHISDYSERVDIRVVDANGLVYSKTDMSFADYDFAESGGMTRLNVAFGLTIGLPITILSLLYQSWPFSWR
jgi:hypothetical protein